MFHTIWGRRLRHTNSFIIQKEIYHLIIHAARTVSRYGQPVC